MPPPAAAQTAAKAARRVTTIGRDPASGIPLDSPVVSRRHALIVREGGSVTIRDLDSRNGTKVNDAFVTTRRLRDGDRIRIGPYELTFHAGTVAVARPSPFPLLRAVDVTRRGSGNFRLDPISLDVSGGELVALLGPSGCGKSTLLKLLAGVWAPAAGEVTLFGEPHRNRLWDVGYVAQDDVSHRFLTIEETVRFAARLRLGGDLLPAELERIVQSTIARVGLADHAGKRVGQISGGQRKRLGVASELVSSPLLMLLDEPTSGLDPDADEQIMRLLRDLATGSRAVVAVTHSMRWLHLCDRLVILNAHGQLAFAGPAGDAPRAFGVDDVADVFERLHGPPRPRRPDAAPRPTLRDAMAPLDAGARPGRPFRRQLPETLTLAHRTALSVARDGLNLAALALAPLVVGVVIALAFGRATFSASGEVTQGAQLLFALTMVVAMLATNGGVRALLRERAAVERELAAGVRAESHVASKILVLGGIAACQALAVAGATFALAPLHEPVGAYAGTLVLLAASAVVALTLGLLLSAVARTEAQAVTMLNFVLIPQLLFAGAIVALREMGSLQHVATVLSARWAYAGMGTAVGLYERAVDDRGFYRFYGREFFSVGIGTTLLILAILGTVCALATCLILQRRR